MNVEYIMFGALMVFLKEILKKKKILKENQQTSKSMQNYPACKESNHLNTLAYYQRYIDNNSKFFKLPKL